MEQELRTVIIIGAGMAGIGASRVLTSHQINHVMLDARDRVGGRIYASQFDGVTVEEGASFVHSPHYQGHLISQFIKKNKVPTIPASFSCECYFYENQNVLHQKHINKAWQVFEQFKQFAQKQNEKRTTDVSVSEVFQQFLALRNQFEEHVANTLRWMIDIHSNVEGGDLHQMSLREYVVSQCESQHDYLPAQGYSSVMQQLLKECSPDIKLQHTVIEIQHSEPQVKVVTDKGTFLSKYVISTLPLGILQQEKVRFEPQLPYLIKDKIMKMGNGVANKLWVSFQTPFWGKRKGWLNFITKTKFNPYPVGYIYPQKKKHILLFFVSGSYSVELSKLTDKEVLEDFVAFLEKFSKEEIKVREIKLTRWQKDPYSLGSYSFCSVGHDHESFSELLSHPIGNKLWFAGQYMHPELNGCAHAAFETGVKAAEQVVQSIKSSL